ncbi:MAG: ShlB/FhaC/HecB family hemolysin secretion/activation protein [Thermodesulfobacteriota bacterium]
MNTPCNPNRRLKCYKILPFCFGFIFLFLASVSAYSQGVLGDPTGRSGKEPQPIPETERGLSLSPLKELVPIPPPIQIPPPAEEKVEPFHLPRIFVREIKITGNTVFSEETLAEVTAPYVNRELSDTDLESLRLALTIFYVNKGYINSGAVIPDQTIIDGMITIDIIEGRLTNIEVEGNKWFRDRYIRSRIRLGGGPPLNILTLQERLQILQQDERIQKLNAELRPDVRRGDSVLKVHVQDEFPIKILLESDNYQSPSVGAERGRITLTDLNLTGFGDVLSFTYGQSSGIFPEIDTSYTLPFTAYDTTLILRYRKNDFNVIEQSFKDLNIKSKSDIASITLRQPFFRTLNREFALALMGEYLRNKTYLDEEPFSFSPGVKDGKSVVSAIRFIQEYLYRDLIQVIAIRSRLSLGINALGATLNSGEDVPDGRFFTWLLQCQWARRFKLLDIQTIARMDLQLANHSLLPLEQISVGGRYSVRGYRENTLVRDNGFIASLESRIPVIRNYFLADFLEFCQFVDFGSAWNKDLPTPKPRSIGSVGLGLRWGVTFKYPVLLRPQFEIYWGVPLKHVDTPGNWNLQDSGIHFRFLISAF